MKTLITNQGCLFCREKRKSSGKEHPIPESLGNKKITIDEGVVCDVCNHGVLAVLDQVLVEFQPIATQRVIHGIRNKKGQLPAARWGNMKLTREPGEMVTIKVDKKSDKHIEISEAGFRVKAKGKFISEKDLAFLYRALCKVALGLLYVDHGELALDERFDRVREITLGKEKARACIYTANDPISDKELLNLATVRYVFNRTDARPAVFFFIYYGVVFMYSPEKPYFDLPKQVDDLNLLRKIEFQIK